jgi:hypothetical protein
MTRRPFLASALAVLLISLSACGGNGDEAGDSTGINGSKVLFVPDKTHSVVGALATLSPVSGATIDSFAFSAFAGDNLQYDPSRDELYGATLAGAQVSVSVYGSASRGSAGAALVRSFKLPADVVRANWLTFDRATGTLYIAATRQGDSTLLAYKNVATLTGTPVPDRNQAFSGGMSQPAFDFSRNIIYAGSARLDLATGVQIATLPGLPAAGTSIAIDAQRDVLYLANSTDNTLRVIAQASTANAAIVATLPLNNIQYVTVDPANNRLYVSVLATAYVFENASAIRGNSAVASSVTSAGATLGGVAFR